MSLIIPTARSRSQGAARLSTGLARLLERSGYATPPVPDMGLAVYDAGPGPAVPACLWYWLSDKEQPNLGATALVARHEQPGRLSNLSHQSSPVDHFRWTYAELTAAAEKLAAHLDSQGVCRGDTVATFVDNSVEWMVLLWASVRIGAVLTPQDPAILNRRDDLQAVIEAVRPKAVLVKDTLEAAKFKSQSKSWRCAVQLICQGKQEQLLENWRLMSAIETEINHALPVPEMELEDTVAIIYSSKPTEEPRGCPYSLTNVISSVEGYRSFHNSQWSHDTVFILSASNFTASCLLSCLNTFSAGGSVVIPDVDFYPETTLSAIHDTQATHLMMVPSQVRGLMSSPDFDKYRPKTLKYVNVSGDAVSKDLIEKARVDLQPERIVQSWGMSEGGPVFGWQTNERVRSYNHIPMLGRALPGSKVKICIAGTDEPARFGEIGELHISSSMIVDTHIGATPSDLFYSDDTNDWFVTGDLAVMEEDGAVAVVGRSKDIIKCSGWALLPSIIEDYIKDFFGIESQAIGVPNPLGGEKPVAVIKVRRASADLKQEMKQGLSRHSGSEYTLGAVYLLSELGLKDWPLGQTRKISKEDLRSAVLQRFPVNPPTSNHSMPMYDMGFLEELNSRLY